MDPLLQVIATGQKLPAKHTINNDYPSILAALDSDASVSWHKGLGG